MVMTNQIVEEWHKHRSAYTMKWQRIMYGRKQVVSVDAEENDQLRNEIVGALRLKREKDAVEKDFHLIEAAIATDRLITSKDETSRMPFKTAAGDVRVLRRIVWVNPTKDDEHR